MDINENVIRNEVGNFINSLQKMLQKTDLMSVLKKDKTTRLSDFHSEAKSVFPGCFFGAKLVLLTDIMDRVRLVQQYNFGKPKESYRCFKQMIHKEMEPEKTNQGLLLDSSGSATATYREVINGSYEMKLTSKIRDLVSSETELAFEKEFEKSTGSVSVNMKDVHPSTLRFVSQYVYKILPELCVGAEMSIRPMVSSDVFMSISTRYELSSFVASYTINNFGFQVCLFKKLAPDLRIATIVNTGRYPTTLGLAVHKSFLNGSEAKVFLDSHCCGGFTFQKEILFHEPQNQVRTLRLVVSTLLDRQRRVRFGFGFNVDF